MKGDFAPLSHVILDPGTTYVRPPELPDRVYLKSPALDVMTDFRYVRPRTTLPTVPIDTALEYMKTSGVRLLLVTDDADHLVGIVTSYDIQGEAPIKIAQETRVPRSQITIAQVMTPQSRVQLISMISVRNAQVGHVVETLRALEQRHLLVLDADEDEGASPAAEAESAFATRAWTDPARSASRPRVGRHPVRGLFSAAQIGRQLRIDLSQVMTAAHSLAEMSHAMG